MKKVAVMPLKMNNERLPGKNTIKLAGKPLLLYALENMVASKSVDSVIVYCSDESVKSLLPEGVVFLKRNQELDLPSANFTQIFNSFKSQVEADIYVYFHATAPFVSIDTIRQCVSEVESGNYDSAFCAVKIQDFLWKRGKPLNFDSKNLPRSQDLEPIYRETSGIYVFTRDSFDKTGSRIGQNPFIKELDYFESVDINNKEDLDLARILVSRKDLIND